MSVSDDLPRDSRWQRTQRRAGCIAGCLTQPFVIVWLVLGSLLAGWLWRRKARPQPAPEGTEGETHD
jgi:hypothetical protein